MSKKKSTGSRRVVLIDGVRTPFVRAFAEFLPYNTIDLGAMATKELLTRTQVPHDAIDAITWGSVIFVGIAPNTAREIVLDVGLPPRVHGMTVTRACASGLQAITSAVEMIERGHADVMIAGGSDSTSNAEVPVPQKLIHLAAPFVFGKSKGMGDLLGVLPQLMPLTSLLPTKPEIAERSTGKTMGQHCEEMAERNQVAREAQDAFAARSHHRAARGYETGRLAAEVMAVKANGKTITADTLVRGDTSLEKLAKLRPVFSRNGTLTAGNSTPLTDGAGAVLLMTEDKAAELGLTPKAAFRSWWYVGIDPHDQLLSGPAYAIPKALAAAGLSLADIENVEIHEAFAAQVLCILKMLGSDAFARERLGLEQAVGAIDDKILNVYGGSVALGHPFAATGARMALTAANNIALDGAKNSLLAICAAGGIGAACVMEAV